MGGRCWGRLSRRTSEFPGHLPKRRAVLTLWDFIEPIRKRLRPEAPAVRRRVAGRGRDDGAMAKRYERVAQEALDEYGIRVRRWRTSMSGVAWYVTYRDGTVKRLIEAPRVRGPVSAAIFLHEVGHHAVGLGVHKPRCLEEYLAWKWSLETMEAKGLNVTEAVRRRMHNSLHYAVSKAKRRGIREVPEELRAYTERMPRGA